MPLISSAPVHVYRSSSTEFRSNTRIPAAFSRAAVASELATAPSSRPLILASSSSEEIRGRAGADADDAVFRHVGDRRFRDRLLEFVLSLVLLRLKLPASIASTPDRHK